MSDVMTLALALFVGAALGAFFFGGLWWTVQKGIASERPAVWFVGSLLLRASLVLAGFYFFSQGHWSRLVACVCGFLIARVIVVRRLARPSAAQVFQPDGGISGRREGMSYDAAEEQARWEKENRIAH
ncbi:MAG TPA: ATP synthase subunit I [Pirellulales bacterium]|nr:ATP synthase subunit I [Pirellulales bacterium]